MLRDSVTRAELLALLPSAEAERLAHTLGLGGQEPYGALAAVQIRKGSSRERELFDFLSVAVPDEPASAAVPSRTEVVPTHALFPHQRVAAARVVDKLDREPNRVLLHMPTGSGKTRTAMSAISHLLTRKEPTLVVWLAHSEELCEQAVEEFSRAWSALGNRSVSVYRWWGPHSPDLADARDGVIVAGLSKVFSAARRSIAEVGVIAGRVGLVVMDEAHQAIAPTYEFVLGVLTRAGASTPMLGLSATPGRTWNDVAEDQRLADFFFRQKVTLEVPGYASPVDYLTDEGYLARVRYESLTHTSDVELSAQDIADLAAGLEVSQRILEQLADDEQRNLLIVHRTEQLLRSHERILIFAATVEHAVVLATVLRSRGIWAQAVTGTTPAASRAHLIAQYRAASTEPRVLVNYGVLTTGFDAPRTSAAVIARPTNSLVLYSQMLGRAIRGPRAGGNERAEIVTVVDTALPGFASVSESFENWEDVWQTTP
jgi:superfamily II DNA or RNA helicase